MSSEAPTAVDVGAVFTELRERLTEAALHRFDVAVAVQLIVDAMEAAGMRPRRVNLAVLSLHPSLAGVGFTWVRDGGPVSRTERPWGFLDTPEHKASTLDAVMRSREPLRLRLHLGEGAERFPLIKDFIAQGGTDYVAFPLQSARKDVHVCTLSTDRPGGWTDDEVRRLQRIMPTLALVIEVFEAHRLTTRERLDLLLMAHTDPMTRLLNRHGVFLEADNRFGAGRPCMAIYIDLDGVKAVNDRMGHLFGDHVITGAAARISGCLPDGAIAGRMGGDEFLVYADEAATDLPGKLCEALAEVYVVNDLPFRLTASLGVADFAPVPMAELSRRADLAMLAAKQAGKNRVVHYAEQTDVRHARAEKIGRLLVGAIERNELRIVVQPIVNLATGEVTHGECLARWTSPELGPVSPGEFITVAEQSGDIRALDRYVLHQAVALLQRLGKDGGRTVPLSVNVSALDASLATLAEDVANALTSHGLSPSQLIVELTESVFIDRFNEATARLNELRAHGIALSLDDFGTGYSSLSYLQRLYFDYIKVDRSLIAALPSERTRAIVESVVGLGRSLQARIVAEGVETAEQRDTLKALKCEYVQGFMYACPLELPEWIELVQSGRALVGVPLDTEPIPAPQPQPMRALRTRGKTAAVLGGGIAGTAVAGRLLQSGWDVHVFERTEPVERPGKGFLLLANGVDAAERLGVWSQLQPLGRRLEALTLREPDGTLIRHEPLTAFGFEHAKVASRLTIGLPPGVVSWGRAVTTVDKAPDGQVRAAFLADGTRIEADLFIAADGNRSVVRNAIHPGARLGPGRVHELVCALHAPDIVQELGGGFLKFVDSKRALALGLVPCGPNNLVWFLQLDSEAVQFEATMHEPRQQLVRSLVGHWASPVAELIERTDFGRSYLWRTADLDPLPSLATANLALVGDAGHPMLPFTSQGVASALTDAAVLGDALDRHPGDVREALARYSELRLPDVTALVTAGRDLQRSFLDRTLRTLDVATPLARTSGTR